jgi:hypothetical protein
MNYRIENRSSNPGRNVFPLLYTMSITSVGTCQMVAACEATSHFHLVLPWDVDKRTLCVRPTLKLHRQKVDLSLRSIN